MSTDQKLHQVALTQALAQLFRERADNGSWNGELSSSALSTALATAVLENSREPDDIAAVSAGRRWLVNHMNADGSWGDTPDSPGNLSATVIAWATLAPALGADDPTIRRVDAWLRVRLGGDPRTGLADAIKKVYGKDRTFATPILFFVALRGMLGPEKESWRQVPSLPFALALLPNALYPHLQLHVVSYAMPALISVGLCRHVHAAAAAGRHPVGREIEPALMKRLTDLQPESGGFLEAIPLTAFTVLALGGAGLHDHPVAQRGRDFLRKARRHDGSWAIDTSLRGWVTALATHACANAPAHPLVCASEWKPTAAWLLQAQQKKIHPFTHAKPGAWAWTDDSGGVPDADDTAGALLALDALVRLGVPDAGDVQAAARGVAWLLDLQNRDGGVPTFCRGWGRLPFDRSAADLTAHALRAWVMWHDRLPSKRARRTAAAIQKAAEFLKETQDSDGAWMPLWFGSQLREDGTNPVIGTARVIPALRAAQKFGCDVTAVLARAEEFLRAAQAPDGGWGAGRGMASTVEETALVVTALVEGEGETRAAGMRGADWLATRVLAGPCQPAPLGLYFAKLWYGEKLYPLVWSIEALGLATRS